MNIKILFISKEKQKTEKSIFSACVLLLDRLHKITLVYVDMLNLDLRWAQKKTFPFEQVNVKTAKQLWQLDLGTYIIRHSEGQTRC